MDMYNAIAGKSADEYKAYVLERLPSIRKAIEQSSYSNACKELLKHTGRSGSNRKNRDDRQRAKICLYCCK